MDKNQCEHRKTEVPNWRTVVDRRTFITSLATMALATGAGAQQCSVVPPGVTLCRAEVNIPQLVAAINVQQCPEWCWAASIAMIFGFCGHPIDQREIVRQMYGAVVCFPAGSSRTIAQALSRTWTDANGNKFTSRVVAAYDPANGINAINNAIIVNELQTDHPLLYCNTSHAMVNFVVDYIPTPMGPNVQAVGVVDPWPSSPRTHPLSKPEMVPIHLGGQMTFLATIRIA
jgi:hypothetical protein